MPIQDFHYGNANQGSLDKLLGFPGQDVARREPPRLVQSATTAAIAVNATFAADPTPGNVLVALLGHRSSGGVMRPFGGGAIWNEGISLAGGALCWNGIFWGVVSASLPVSRDVGLWCNSSTTAPGMVVMEWSLTDGGVVWGSSSAQGASGATWTAPSLQFPPLGVAFGQACSNSSTAASLPANWVSAGQPQSSNVGGYRIANGLAFSAAFTGGSSTWSAVMMGLS